MIGDVILNVLHSVTSLCRNHDVIWSPCYDHIRLLTQPPPPAYNAAYIYYLHLLPLKVIKIKTRTFVL